MQAICEVNPNALLVQTEDLAKIYSTPKLAYQAGYYEPGVFDLRSPRPRQTAIAKMVRDLATGHKPNHPLVDIPGWWHRQQRLLYPAVICHRGTGESKSMNLA
ncbi:hypothetical protein A6S26_06380 [Nostoc sp. ATCC 43529]|nr:hypothetical protein A6S26_06380 [Nostoc sp. ATCC 43529]